MTAARGLCLSKVKESLFPSELISTPAGREQRDHGVTVYEQSFLELLMGDLI